MEGFFSIIEDLKKRLEKINRAIGDIDHNHRLVLNAINVEEATRLGRVIDELVRRTNNEAQYIRRTLKELTAETEELGESRAASPSDLRIRLNQERRWAKKFMAAMSKFQVMQQTYQNKYRAQLERQYLIVKPQSTREELDRLTHSTDATQLLNMQIFSMANRAQAQRQLDEMRERHHDIVAIEESLRQLHQMFVDMAIIVENQGEIIDKVEEHVSGTVEYTEHAAQEMRQAVVKQRGIQKKKWILIIVCVVLLLIIGLVVWLSFWTPGSGSSGGGGGGAPAGRAESSRALPAKVGPEPTSRHPTKQNNSKKAPSSGASSRLSTAARGLMPFHSLDLSSLHLNPVPKSFAVD